MRGSLGKSEMGNKSQILRRDYSDYGGARSPRSNSDVIYMFCAKFESRRWYSWHSRSTVSKNIFREYSLWVSSSSPFWGDRLLLASVIALSRAVGSLNIRAWLKRLNYADALHWDGARWFLTGCIFHVVLFVFELKKCVHFQAASCLYGSVIRWLITLWFNTLSHGNGGKHWVFEKRICENNYYYCI